MSMGCIIIHAIIFKLSLQSIFLHPRLNPKTLNLAPIQQLNFGPRMGL